MLSPEQKDMEKIVSLCKRRGFVFQSSEIYGGLGSTWDYGPLGVELKNNVKQAWWRAVVHGRDDVVGLDSAILMHPRVWEASGHTENFADPLVECKACHQRFRADQLNYAQEVRLDAAKAWLDLPTVAGKNYIVFQGFEIEAPNASVTLQAARLSNTWYDQPVPSHAIPRLKAGVYPLELGSSLHPGPRDYAIGFEISSAQPLAYGTTLTMVFRGRRGLLTPVALSASFAALDVTVGQPAPSCPDCGGELTEPRMFNLMAKTFLGPVEDTAHAVYLRPETAQGIFVNFQNVLTVTRKRLPLGIAQIGKSFRNEITPGNFIFRTREFEQMECEFFVVPGTDEEWHQRWVQERFAWYKRLGIREENLRLRQHAKDELAHYAKACSDVEYRFPWGWAELEGIANRTDFDLKRHAEFSGKDLSYFDDESKERFYPFVIEPSGGVDRTALAFLVDAYDEEPDPGAKETRTVLRFHRDIAPVKVAILPLSRNERLVPTAREVYALVRPHFPTMYDDAQSIGRRYRRQDEIGTPFCVTIDFESLEDKQVTIRDRDSMKQVRVPIAELAVKLKDMLDKGW